METGQEFSHSKIRASEREHGLSRVNVCHGFWRPLERGVELFHARATFLVAVHLGAWMTLAMAEHKAKHEIDRSARPASLECKTSVRCFDDIMGTGDDGGHAVRVFTTTRD